MNKTGISGTEFKCAIDSIFLLLVETIIPGFRGGNSASSFEPKLLDVDRENGKLFMFLERNHG